MKKARGFSNQKLGAKLPTIQVNIGLQPSLRTKHGNNNFSYLCKKNRITNNCLLYSFKAHKRQHLKYWQKKYKNQKP